MIHFFKYTLWPAIKTRFLYWWWIVRYGGKKNIPPEIVFGKIEETTNALMEDIMNAARVESSDMTIEELGQFRDLIMKINELKGSVGDLRKETKE